MHSDRARVRRVGTAHGPLSACWFDRNLGTREDEPSNRLLVVLPCVPQLGLRLVAGPILPAHRVTGHVPKAFRYPFEGDVPPQHQASAHVAYFDNAIDRYIDHTTLHIILGAGFDNRTFRRGEHVRARSFEVDAPLSAQAGGGGQAMD